MSVKLQVAVKATKLEVVKDLAEVLTDIVKDERLPKTVKDEYVERIKSVLKRIDVE